MAAAKKEVIYATGRRKTSKARVFLKPGSGKIEINGKPMDQYLSTGVAKISVLLPFQVADVKNRFDAMITVAGGGLTGQAEAIRHGLSRALVAADPMFRAALKKAGFMTRDPRAVERKKYGKHKARRSTQFSKR